MKRVTGLVCLVLAGMATPAAGQRRPVLPQIDEPHPYYYRELYLPQLTSGPSALTWGPDSKELIYSMAGSLWRQRLDSKEAVELTDGPGYDYQPDWSPNGKSVVYVSYRQDAMELWLLDLASGRTKQLTNGGAVNVEPRWSPDGKQLVWVSTEYHGRFHVFRADFADGQLANAVRLTGETKSVLPRYYYSAYDMEISPVWTPDGKEILFVSNKGHIYGTGGFWLMKAEPGAEAREIHYEETSWKARPDFSPDGSRMVYSSYLGGQYHNLWMMPARGGDSFPLTYNAWDSTNIRWAPDGKQLAFVSNGRIAGGTQIKFQEAFGGPAGTLAIEKRVPMNPRGVLELRVMNEKGENTRARVSISDESGRTWAPETGRVIADDGYDRRDSAFEPHYFHLLDPSEPTILSVPTGEITIKVSKGLEYKPLTRVVSIRPGDQKRLELKLGRLEEQAPQWRNWISGDLHVHMNYGGTYLEGAPDLERRAEAEDLRIVNNLIVNKEQRIPDIGADTDTVGESQIVRGQEFHTSYWGHRGIVHLRGALILPGYAGYPNTAAASLYPMNADVYDIAHAQKALVGAVHPFDKVPDPFAEPAQPITDELPVDVALGKLDYMEIVGFSDHKSTAAVWYKLLNLGFKLPAGAGTDATTNYAAPIRGQVGFDRVYVWMTEWPASLQAWMDQLKQGRTFATNGPLVEFTLAGEMVGNELKFDAPQSAIPFTAKLRSIVPVDHLEVVCNGQMVRSLKLDGGQRTADAAGSIALDKSGWCVLRAWSEKAEYPLMDQYAYATTSPVYVTIAGKRAYAQEDAVYFTGWIDRSIETTEQYPYWNSTAEKRGVMSKLREARAVYENMK